MALYSSGYFLGQAIIRGIRDYEERKRREEQEALEKKAKETQIKETEQLMKLREREFETNKEISEFRLKKLAIDQQIEKINLAQQIVRMNIDLNDPNTIKQFGAGVVNLAKSYKSKLDEIWDGFNTRVEQIEKLQSMLETISNNPDEESKINIGEINNKIELANKELENYISTYRPYLSEEELRKMYNTYKFNIDAVNMNFKNMAEAVRKNLTKEYLKYERQYNNIIPINDLNKKNERLNNLLKSVSAVINDINNDTILFLAGKDKILGKVIDSIYGLHQQIGNEIKRVNNQQQSILSMDVKEFNKRSDSFYKEIAKRIDNSNTYKIFSFLVKPKTNQNTDILLPIKKVEEEKLKGNELNKKEYIKIGQWVYPKEDVIYLIMSDLEDISDYVNEVKPYLNFEDKVNIKNKIRTFKRDANYLINLINQSERLKKEETNKGKIEGGKVIELETQIRGKEKESKRNKQKPSATNSIYNLKFWQLK